MDCLETQIEAAMDDFVMGNMGKVDEEPEDGKRRQAVKDRKIWSEMKWSNFENFQEKRFCNLKGCVLFGSPIREETKPLMICKPEMLAEKAETLELQSVELETDAYKAQLLQQKATKVAAAADVLSKAKGDSKVIKTQAKPGRGRGKGRGRGRGSKAPQVATEVGDGDEKKDEKKDDGNDGDDKTECEAKETDVPDVEKAEEVKGSNPDGEEGGETKKTYKRKVHTPEELKEMWKLKVSGLNVLFINTGAMNL